MQWILGNNRPSTRVGALLTALCVAATALVALPAAGALESQRRACDELLIATHDGVATSLALVAPNGTGYEDLIDTIDSGPISDGADTPTWAASGDVIWWPEQSTTHEDTGAAWYVNRDGSGRGETVPSPAPAGVDLDNLDSVLPSPDGTRLLLDYNDGMMVMNVDGSGAFVLADVGPGPAPTSNAEAVWSPDGTQIMWRGTLASEREILIADADGTNRFIASQAGTDPDPTSNGSPAWSPDGTQIAWSGQDEIFVADADGTNRSSIADAGAGTDPTNNHRPQFSPDGMRIAWDGYDGTSSQIYVSDLDGTNRSAITSGGAAAEMQGPAWSFDSSMLLWENEGDTVVANADGTDAVNLTAVLEAAGAGARDAAWSPTRNELAVEHDNYLFIVEPDGTNLRLVSADGDVQSPGDTAWSPDGSELALDGYRNGVYIPMILGESGVTEIATDPGTELYFPIWAADGTQTVWIDGGSDTLTLVDHATMDVSPLIPNPSDHPEHIGDPHWAADGSIITFTGDTGDDEVIFTVRPDGTELTAHAPTGIVELTNIDTPQASPDGTMVAFQGSYDVDDSRERGIFVMTLATNVAVEISEPADDLYDDEPRWSPDGSLVAWEGRRESGIYGIKVAAPDGSGRRVLSPDDGNDHDTFSFSPDGQLLSWIRWDSDTDRGDLVTGDLDGNIIAVALSSDVDGLEYFDRPQWRPRVETPFTDMPDTSFAIDDVTCIFGMEITRGTGDGSTYSPSSLVTRQQMAAFLGRLWRALGNDCPTEPAHGFTDVDPADWSSNDITCIKHLGITTGTGDGSTYSPTDNVTREQMAAFLGRLWRALGNECPDGPAHGFTDVSLTSYANDEIGCIKALGITTGTTATTYSPANHVTREQMAAFIARLVRAHTARG